MMKRVPVLLAAATLALAPGQALAQAAPAQPVTIASALQGSYTRIKSNLLAAAERMPEADYASKPSSMEVVRTYGQLFGHVANSQFNACAAARGVPNPNQGKNNEDLTTKAEFIKALSDSFAFCDPAFESLTDASALELVTGGRGGPAPRLVGLFGLIAHSNEMYGTAAVYLRHKNLVPPSSDERPRG